MASKEDIIRITRRSEALKSLSLGDAPVLDPSTFARFPDMQRAAIQFNEQQDRSYIRLKNLLAEALINLKLPLIDEFIKQTNADIAAAQAAIEALQNAPVASQCCEDLKLLVAALTIRVKNLEDAPDPISGGAGEDLVFALMGA